MNTNKQKIWKIAVSLFLVVALLTPYVSAAVPESNGSFLGSEASDSHTAASYPWELDLGQDVHEEIASRSLEELKALEGVTLDESGRATSVALNAGLSNEETLRLFLNYDENIPAARTLSVVETIEQSIEEKLQDTFGFSSAVVQNAVDLHGDMSVFQTELRYYLTTKKNRTINTEMEDAVLYLICSGYTTNQAFGVYAAQGTLGMSIEELAQAKRDEIALLRDVSEAETEVEDNRDPDYLELSDYMGVPYSVIENFMAGHKASVSQLRSTYAAEKKACYALSPVLSSEKEDILLQEENVPQLEETQDIDDKDGVSVDPSLPAPENPDSASLPLDDTGDAQSEEPGMVSTKEDPWQDRAQTQGTPAISAGTDHVINQEEPDLSADSRSLAEALSETTHPEELAAQEQVTVPLSNSNNGYSPEQVLNKPFSYDTIGTLDVNINTGSYKYTETDLTIPGVNGLDLNFTRIFDTTSSWLNIPIGMYDLLYENVVTIEAGFKCYLWTNPNGVPGDPMENSEFIEISDISQYTFADNYLNDLVQVSYRYTTKNYEMAAAAKQYLDEEYTYLAYATDRAGHGYGILISHEIRPIDSVIFSEAFQNYNVTYSYQVNEFGLGHGWRLGFSAIEEYYSNYDLDRKKRLITRDGSRYSIREFNGGTAEFENYELRNFTLQDNGNGYPGAAYTLTHKDGVREYFDGNGRNIAIVDRYGNKITLEYIIVNSAVNQIKITDTLGNVLIYKNENIEQVDQLIPNVGGVNVFNTLWTLSLNNAVIKNYYIQQSTTSGSRPIPKCTLVGVIDNLGQDVLYKYSWPSKKYNCYIGSPATNDANIFFLILHRINYPNQLEKNFMHATSQNSRGRLGVSGYIEGIQLSQYNEYDDSDNGRGVSRNYTYGDYSNCYRPYFSNYKYSTNIQTVMISDNSNYYTWRVRDETYQFDMSHLKVSKTTTAYTPLQTELVKGAEDLPGQYPNAVAEVESYKFDDNYLPTQIVTKSYTWGTQSHMTQTRNYTYDNKGNVLAETKPNNQTTTYTYDPSYAIPLTVSYPKDASTTVTVTNTLTADGKSIAATEVKKNGTLAGKTAYAYDSTGRVVNQKDYIDTSNYVEQAFVYNGSAQPTERRYVNVKGWDGQLVVGSPGYGAGVIAERTAYNTRGQPAKVTDANGNETNIVYLTDGRVSQVTNPDGTTASYVYNVKDGIVTYKDELGTVYRHSYDAFGNLNEIYDVAGNQVLKTIRYNSLSISASD